MQARHYIHPLPRQPRQRDIIAVRPVAQQDVAGLEAFPQPVEQPQVVAVQVAHHHVQQRPAGQREEHHQLHHRETAPAFLPRGLRIVLLVGGGVGQLHRTAIHHLHRAALKLRAGTGPLFGRARRGRQHRGQTLQGEALPGLDVSGGAFVHRAPAVQAGQRLHLADDFAAGGVALEHLPEETLAGQAQGVETLAAVGALVGAGKEVAGKEIGQMPGQLLQRGLTEVTGGALAQGGEPGAEGGEERCGHRAVLLPLY